MFSSMGSHKLEFVWTLGYLLGRIGGGWSKNERFQEKQKRFKKK
jgi:hypothetical protein